MRLIAGLTGVGLLLGAITFPGAAAAWERIQERSDEVVDAAGLRALEVENSRGSIEVRPSGDGRIHLAATKVVRAETRGHAEELAREIEVTTDRREGRYVITVHYARHTNVHVGFFQLFSGFELPLAEVRMVIEAPAALIVRLTAASGDLTTEGRSGAQTLETRSGDITVRDARGVLEASSASGDLAVSGVQAARLRSLSGDVSLAGARGPVRVTTTSGNVEVKGASDSLSLESTSGDVSADTAPRGLWAGTVSGDISVHEVAGEIRARSTSGGITLGLAAPLRRVDASSQSGEVHVTIAHGVGATLDLHSTSGTLDVNLPLALDKAERHAILGRVGSGGAPVTLRSTSGDITVESGDR